MDAPTSHDYDADNHGHVRHRSVYLYDSSIKMVGIICYRRASFRYCYSQLLGGRKMGQDFLYGASSPFNSCTQQVLFGKKDAQ